MKNFLRALIYNLALLIIVALLALFFAEIDNFFKLPNFQASWSIVLGLVLLAIGLYFRVWASYVFFEAEIKHLAKKPQAKLITKGPFAISRNPLYLGIIFIIFAASFIAGSLSGLIACALFFILLNWHTRSVDEAGLEKAFGDEYRQYKSKVYRWLGSK
jgi:protein-S-isoprenylcysteine O-methyltransferase Ste14